VNRVYIDKDENILYAECKNGNVKIAKLQNLINFEEEVLQTD